MRKAASAWPAVPLSFRTLQGSERSPLRWRHALPRSQNRFSQPPNLPRLSDGFADAISPANRRHRRRPTVGRPSAARRPIRSGCPATAGP